ncbi:ribosomal protein S5 domain 2-like protein [Epithele typhae]|uniref:ribosomal protein S5 domain 2-like protein n=1 Tax=Epithele typhae TaxID=378194 RepID=UPI002008C50A|nr:ribosomal protein S5 domain 2-like protein [Epithele typhae]KAH9939311.1 ribosomal protein S5 domain 2-like protein [Epithele typhae]
MAALASSSASALPPSTEADTLKALTFQRLHPRTYLARFLAEGVRPDGRELDDWRDLSVHVGSISTADGSALVRLGATTVVCGVKAEIAEPELDRPGEGFLVPNLDLPAICSPRFKPGPPTDEAQVLSDRLNEVLVASGVVPPASLCIAPGRAAWVLYVDATCINYDGNAFDAALLAMVAALKNVRLPKAVYDEDLRRTRCSRKERVPLQLGRLPTSFSFGVTDGTHTLADPTAFEEPLLDTTLTVVVDDRGALVAATQRGLGLGLGAAGDDQEDVLRRCVEAARECWTRSRRDVYALGSRP